MSHAGESQDDARWDRFLGGGAIGLLGDPDAVIGAARVIARCREWSLAIGAGDVDQPIPDDLAWLDGEAVRLAQQALQRAAKERSRTPVAVAGSGRVAAADAEALFTILSHQWCARTDAGRQAVAAVQGAGGPVPQATAAAALGITQQALSKRLRAAGWAAEQGILPLLRRRLAAAVGHPNTVLPT